jgi:hypothetical protein
MADRNQRERAAEAKSGLAVRRSELYSGTIYFGGDQTIFLSGGRRNFESMKPDGINFPQKAADYKAVAKSTSIDQMNYRTPVFSEICVQEGGQESHTDQKCLRF